MSPGATVRFAKATIHRVEVGPGRRFLPVKRKSKSTLTYISPLDPGSQKSAPKTMLQNPTKLRRHQENQAAMGRYWLRTEEEEAQWRAEAERRAAEEAERYRNEPASPPAAPSAPKADLEDADDGGVSLVDKTSLVDQRSAPNSDAALDKVEEEEAEFENCETDKEAGAKFDQEADETERLALKEPAEARHGIDGSGEDGKDARVPEEPRATVQVQTPLKSPEEGGDDSPGSARTGGESPKPTTKSTMASETTHNPEAKAAATTPAPAPAPAEAQPPTENHATLPESSSLSETSTGEPAAKATSNGVASPSQSPGSGASTTESGKDQTPRIALGSPPNDDKIEPGIATGRPNSAHASGASNSGNGSTSSSSSS
ncbi:fb76c483-83b0-411c-9bcb-fd5f68acd94d [Thermothielavioides terrestris]|nr:fb76c483-83b0-411c-9bcb-fd5f68acd94d [Thermothielavioides terrestris]